MPRLPQASLDALQSAAQIDAENLGAEHRRNRPEFRDLRFHTQLFWTAPRASCVGTARFDPRANSAASAVAGRGDLPARNAACNDCRITERRPAPSDDIDELVARRIRLRNAISPAGFFFGHPHEIAHALAEVERFAPCRDACALPDAAAADSAEPFRLRLEIVPLVRGVHGDVVDTLEPIDKTLEPIRKRLVCEIQIGEQGIAAARRERARA